MVATFEFDEFNGAGTIQTHNIAHANLGAVDATGIDITVEANKIARGSNSFSKYIAGHFSGTYTQIGPNGKVWHSTKVGIDDSTIILKGTVTQTYATPTTTATGDVTFPSTEGTATAVTFGATCATASATTSTANPAYTAYVRMQLQTTGSAATGALGTNTLSLKYDES